jgi:hypothetical protein
MQIAWYSKTAGRRVSECRSNIAGNLCRQAESKWAWAWVWDRCGWVWMCDVWALMGWRAQVLRLTDELRERTEQLHGAMSLAADMGDELSWVM